MHVTPKSILFVLLWLPLAALASDFQEGTHYRRLANPVPTSTGDKIEVVELFWYGCPHCYSLEPITDKWLEHKPDNVEFVRIPAVLGARWELGARAYYVAETLGVLDRIHAPLFAAFHVQKRRLRSEEGMAEFFAEHGVDLTAFRENFASFGVETKLRRAQQVVKRYRIDGVPAVIINGKYETTSSMAGSPAKIFKVVDYLIRKENEAR